MTEFEIEQIIQEANLEIIYYCGSKTKYHIFTFSFGHIFIGLEYFIHSNNNNCQLSNYNFKDANRTSVMWPARHIKSKYVGPYTQLHVEETNDNSSIDFKEALTFLKKLNVINQHEN